MTLVLLVAVGLLLPAAGWAEVRRLEAVGATPIDPTQRGTLGLRDKAIKEALREAVIRVGRELLLEVEAPEDPEVALEEVFSTGMARYTTRFQVLDDQGERPAMFSEDPGVAIEYVVIVEVDVDVDRVESRLVGAGLMARSETSLERSRLLIEAEGLGQYPAYQAFRELLTASAGARPAQPVSFERGRAVFAVDIETSVDPAEFLKRMEGLAPESLGIRLVDLGEDTLAVSVTWSPPEPDVESSEEW